MSQPFTIKLGELRLAHYDLSAKAALLDQIALRDLSNKGLMPARFAPIKMRVPAGGVILDEFFRHATSAGLARIDGKRVVIDDAKAFMDAIELPPISGRVAVRSAFTGEDAAAMSLAGKFASVLDVPIESYDISPSRVRDPKPLARAIAEVWSSGLAGAAFGRLDVLVMEMVEPKYSGVAFTETDYEDDLVNYTEGLAADMLAGKTDAQSLELPRLLSLEFPSRDHHNLAFASRLQMLLRSIRLGMGKGSWDVEWADDGVDIWVIQVRPITAPTVRNEIFSYAPIKETLPELPSRFMATLIESCGDDIFDFYRAVDPSLPRDRSYIEVFYGRPMVNVSLLMDMVRRWGEPTSRVTRAVGGVPGNEMPANKRRAFKSRSLRFGLRLRSARAASESKAVAAELLALGETPGDTIGEVIETARLAYSTLMRHMLALRIAIGSASLPPGARTLGTQMYTELAPMRELARANPEIAASLAKGQLPRDTGFRLRWDAWLRKHGHRATYETDLGRPRFHESQADVLQMIAAPSANAPVARKSPAAPLLARTPAARAYRAREELRFDAMIAFDRIRRRLLQLAVPKGVSAEMLFSLTIEEARKLDAGWRPSAKFTKERQQENKQLAALRIPDVIRRNDAIEGAGASRSYHGVGLTRGEATGKAWVLREPAYRLPAGYKPHETILVAPSIDAGWTPTFGLVAGVVVETGGSLSHGAIVLRELCIPSVTNVRGSSHEIRPGDRVRVVGSQGRVDVLN